MAKLKFPLQQDFSCRPSIDNEYLYGTSIPICLDVTVVTIGEHYLEALHEGPEQDADGVALPQQLYQPRRAEQTQETHVEEVFLKS